MYIIYTFYIIWAVILLHISRFTQLSTNEQKQKKNLKLVYKYEPCRRIFVGSKRYNDRTCNRTLDFFGGSEQEDKEALYHFQVQRELDRARARQIPRSSSAVSLILSFQLPRWFQNVSNRFATALCRRWNYSL